MPPATTHLQYPLPFSDHLGLDISIDKYIKENTSINVAPPSRGLGGALFWRAVYDVRPVFAPCYRSNERQKKDLHLNESTLYMVGNGGGEHRGGKQRQIISPQHCHHCHLGLTLRLLLPI